MRALRLYAQHAAGAHAATLGPLGSRTRTTTSGHQLITIGVDPFRKAETSLVVVGVVRDTYDRRTAFRLLVTEFVRRRRLGPYPSHTGRSGTSASSVRPGSVAHKRSSSAFLFLLLAQATMGKGARALAREPLAIHYTCLGPTKRVHRARAGEQPSDARAHASDPRRQRLRTPVRPGHRAHPQGVRNSCIDLTPLSRKC